METKVGDAINPGMMVKYQHLDREHTVLQILNVTCMEKKQQCEELDMHTVPAV